MSGLKKPPYARELIQQGGAVWLYFGAHSAWGRVQASRAQGWRNALLLPLGEQPGDFDWSCVAGCAVMVVELAETSADQRQALVRTLAVYGACEAYLCAYSQRAADCVCWNCPPLSRPEAA